MMKPFLLLTALLFILTSKAQKGPLKCSGKIINKEFSYADFDKIGLADLDGKVAIEAGKPFSINIAIDDNLESLLEVSNNNGKLTIGLKDNKNNKLYIENTGIDVKISLPSLTLLEQAGNNSVLVNGIAGRYLRLKKSGNGNVVLNGRIDELEIQKTGNGEVKAMNLIAQKVTVHSTGNGDVMVNAQKMFKASGSGNGDIRNMGSALADRQSFKSGNGQIIDSGSLPEVSSYSNQEKEVRVLSSIENKTDERAELKVVYPVKGNYGISIKPGTIHKEYFPIGTKIYRKGKMKQPLFEITAANRQTVLVIE